MNTFMNSFMSKRRRCSQAAAEHTLFQDGAFMQRTVNEFLGDRDRQSLQVSKHYFKGLTAACTTPPPLLAEFTVPNLFKRPSSSSTTCTGLLWYLGDEGCCYKLVPQALNAAILQPNLEAAEAIVQVPGALADSIGHSRREIALSGQQASDAMKLFLFRTGYTLHPLIQVEDIEPWPQPEVFDYMNAPHEQIMRIHNPRIRLPNCQLPLGCVVSMTTLEQAVRQQSLAAVQCLMANEPVQLWKTHLNQWVRGQQQIAQELESHGYLVSDALAPYIECTVGQRVDPSVQETYWRIVYRGHRYKLEFDYLKKAVRNEDARMVAYFLGRQFHHAEYHFVFEEIKKLLETASPTMQRLIYAKTGERSGPVGLFRYVQKETNSRVQPPTSRFFILSPTGERRAELFPDVFQRIIRDSNVHALYTLIEHEQILDLVNWLEIKTAFNEVDGPQCNQCSAEMRTAIMSLVPRQHPCAVITVPKGGALPVAGQPCAADEYDAADGGLRYQLLNVQKICRLLLTLDLDGTDVVEVRRAIVHSGLARKVIRRLLNAPQHKIDWWKKAETIVQLAYQIRDSTERKAALNQHDKSDNECTLLHQLMHLDTSTVSEKQLRSVIKALLKLGADPQEQCCFFTDLSTTGGDTAALEEGWFSVRQYLHVLVHQKQQQQQQQHTEFDEQRKFKVLDKFGVSE